jgi:hypothetical protein
VAGNGRKPRLYAWRRGSVAIFSGKSQESARGEMLKQTDRMS